MKTVSEIIDICDIANGSGVNLEWEEWQTLRTAVLAQPTKQTTEDSAQISARMLELAADPCREGYVPISPETLREWAQKLMHR